MLTFFTIHLLNICLIDNIKITSRQRTCQDKHRNHPETLPESTAIRAIYFPSGIFHFKEDKTKAPAFHGRSSSCNDVSVILQDIPVQGNLRKLR